jgi:predicted nucleic acid-binding protein
VPPRFVVDSSVVLKFYLHDEDLVDRAHEVLQAYAEGRIELLAPFVLLYEVPGSIRKAVLKKRISWAKAHTLVGAFITLPLPFVTPDPTTSRQVVTRAFDLSEQLNRSFYDAVFVAFAEMLDVPFLTADGPLARSAAAVVDAVFLEAFRLP